MNIAFNICKTKISQYACNIVNNNEDKARTLSSSTWKNNRKSALFFFFIFNFKIFVYFFIKKNNFVHLIEVTLDLIEIKCFLLQFLFASQDGSRVATKTLVGANNELIMIVSKSSFFSDWYSYRCRIVCKFISKIWLTKLWNHVQKTARI